MKLVVLRCSDPDVHGIVDQVLILVEDDVKYADLERDQRLVDILVDPIAVAHIEVDYSAGHVLKDEMGDDRPYIG